jgi:isoamylase
VSAAERFDLAGRTAWNGTRVAARAMMTACETAMTLGKLWSANEGLPTPLGATWIAFERSFNFAIYSRYAEDVALCFYSATSYTVPCFEYAFDPLRNKTGRVWHARIPADRIEAASYYAYSIGGPPATGDRFERHAFHREKLLLDPYATAVFFLRSLIARLP